MGFSARLQGFRSTDRHMEHVYSVKSISELKEVMPESGGSVFVTGHTRPGDGGGGLFHWITDSSAPPDDGIVVKGSNDTGFVLIKKKRNYIHV